MSAIRIRQDSSLMLAVEIVVHAHRLRHFLGEDLKGGGVVVAQECGELVRLVVDAGCGRDAKHAGGDLDHSLHFNINGF